MLYQEPYVEPVVSAVSLIVNVKEIVENLTPLGVTKIIAGHLINDCTPPELLIAGKCVMLAGRIIESVASGGNPLVTRKEIMIEYNIKEIMGIKKRIKKISSTALQAIPNGNTVRDTILSQGMKATEASAYFWGNLTKTVQDTSKGALTAHSGKRVATTGFKATKDFGRNDPVCGTLCTVSACCETLSGVIVWVPFPGKICTVSALKATSICCERLRDLCAGDSSNPLCK